jgi:hypothetical protein
MNAQYARNFSINRISMLYFLTGPPRGWQRAVMAKYDENENENMMKI